MGFWHGVTPQTVANAPDGFKEFQVGENEAFIQQVNETVSKSGKQMLDIIFKKTDGAEIHYYIIDDEYKMQKLKQLYQCFSIPFGNTEIDTVWKGRTGIVVCKQGEPYNGKVYNKVSFLRPLFTNGNKSQKTIEPGYMTQTAPSDDFTDDIPF